MASLGDTPPSSLRDVRYCVILTQGDDVPAEFVASLERNAIETVLRSHPLLAFADLLAHERGHRKGGWGLPNVARSALIIADRDRWDRLDRLLEAVRRELPNVAVWVSSSNLLLEVGEVPVVDDLPAFPEGPQVRLAGTLAADAPSSAGESDVASRPESTDSPTATPASSTRGPNAPHTQAETPSADGGAGSGSSEEPPPPPPRNRSGGSPAVTPEEIEMLLQPPSQDHPDAKPRDPPPTSP